MSIQELIDEFSIELGRNNFGNIALPPIGFVFPVMKTDATELAAVAKDESAFFLKQNEMVVLFRAITLPFDAQSTGHTKMNGEHAFVQFQHDKLAMPANRFYSLIAHSPAKVGKLLPDYVVRGKLRVNYGASGKFRGQRSDDGFNFR